MHPFESEPEGGFTLVELLIVVMIIGILITIAAPVYIGAQSVAETQACQANQRMIIGTIELAKSLSQTGATQTEGVLRPGGSGWYAVLVPQWIKTLPLCPTDRSEYFMSDSGRVMGDTGVSPFFHAGHALIPD